MGFVIKSDYVDVTGQNYKGNEYVNGINVSFYTGTITINVKNNFQFMSVYFLNKGYLGGEKRFVFTQLCSAMKCGCDTFQSYNTPTLNRITQWTLTFDNSNLQMYIDGRLTNSTTSAVAQTATAADFYLATYRTDASEAFSGTIYSSAVYNRVLTASEVLQNYNATKSRFGL